MKPFTTLAILGSLLAIALPAAAAPTDAPLPCGYLVSLANDQLQAGVCVAPPTLCVLYFDQAITKVGEAQVCFCRPCAAPVPYLP